MDLLYEIQIRQLVLVEEELSLHTCYTLADPRRDLHAHRASGPIVTGCMSHLDPITPINSGHSGIIVGRHG